MVTIIARNGVTLSAGSRANGFVSAGVPLVFKVAGMGDYANREEGRQRRAERRRRHAERFAYLDSRD